MACVKELGGFESTPQTNFVEKAGGLRKQLGGFNPATTKSLVLECSGISWTIIQTICTSLQTDNRTNTSSVNFYRLGAPADAQPTVSKR